MSLDVHWHDTYFVVAHFHFIMVGGTLTAFLAALHYWFPKMTGRMYSGALGAARGGAGLRRLLRHVLPAVPPRQRRHAAPLLRLPAAVPGAARDLDGRRVGARRRRSSCTLVYLVVRALPRRRAGDNPWGSRRSSGARASPPPKHNFDAPPRLRRAAPTTTRHRARRTAPHEP